MNKYEEFTKMFVKYQLDYNDLICDTYAEYVSKQKEYYAEKVHKSIEFETWFDSWCLSEDEFRYCKEIVEELEDND